MHSQVAKAKMMDQIEELQEQNRRSTQLLHSLTASRVASVQQSPPKDSIAASIAPPWSAERGPGTCDACKFRHQRCDRSKPACGTCQERRLKCQFTTVAASMVERPTLLNESSRELLRDGEGEESNRSKSFSMETADTGLSSLSEATSRNPDEHSHLSVKRLQITIVSVS